MFEALLLLKLAEAILGLAEDKALFFLVPLTLNLEPPLFPVS